MLKAKREKYYKVKAGQSLAQVADFFCVAERLIIQENGLTEELSAGQILRIPSEKGNAYVVQSGDTKELLCGSADNFRRKNGTDDFYIGMKVIL